MRFQIFDDEERLARFRLARTKNVGSITFFQLLKRYGSATAALRMLPSLSTRGGARKSLQPCSMSAIHKEIKQLEALQADLLIYGDDDYPELLAQIAAPPPVLTLKGHRHLLQKKAVGIVGSRYCSVAGEKLAYRFARDLSHADFIVVSGLARGIDAKAHEGSLEKGTIGVMGSGFLHPYPKENQQLFDDIERIGLLVSEHAPDVGVHGRLFPARNRIIAGLSLGVLVVEASVRSGSLITARLALESSREVFAIPGSPLDQRSQGCNQLLREGAHLTESIQDVLDVLESKPPKISAHHVSPHFTFAETADRMHEVEDGKELEEIRNKILQGVSYTPTAMELLLDSLSSSRKLGLIALTDLELAGKIEIALGGNVTRIVDEV